MKIVFASSNTGKIAELQQLVAPFQFEIIPQNTLGITDVAETACTFVENALLKARHAARLSHCAAIADDSGLVVQALQGAPGIFSARYAGANANAKNNIEKLLAEMKMISEAKRQAYFYCALVYLQHAEDPTPIICEGIWHGKILFAPQGEQGFGYDPIFYVPEKNCSAAELSLEIKNQISHRGKALKRLVEKLYERTLSQKS